MSNSIYCPFCHKHVELSNRGNCNTRTGDYWMGECNSCHKVVLTHINSGEIFPNPQPKPIDERIKKAIFDDFKESLICFSVSCYRAAAVMARRAIQSICLDKGAKEGNNLKDQIEWLFAQGIITKDIKEWAHEVRFVGNDAAHPKKPENDSAITKDDADEIIQLLEQLCQVLYVTPSIAEERKKARTIT